MNFVCPNLNHIAESYWNNKLKEQNINFVVEYGYPNDTNDIVVIADAEILNPNENYKNLYGWIIESPDILEYFTPGYFDKIKQNSHLFKKIFTHNCDLINYSDKFIFYPHGGCWITKPKFEKTKLISIISSGKNWIAGHNFRLKVVGNISHKIDFFGRDSNLISTKEEGLNEYMYSIAIENCKKDYYFTEKIIDCFRTKTIPIYWGCPSIGDFFDIDGIITFNTIDELNSILPTLTKEYYYSKMEAVENNYKKSFEYDSHFSKCHIFLNI
jgi:hypothetical protein